jgi:hypothetical protein
VTGLGETEWVKLEGDETAAAGKADAPVVVTRLKY